MSGATPQTRTLYRALENCGGLGALADTLEVSVELLSRWLAGVDVPPVKVYLLALDLVARRAPPKRGQSNR